MYKQIDIKIIDIHNKMIDSEKQLNNNKIKKKCPECNKKLSLIDIVCRCGIQYCRNHSQPEYHNCKYDIAADKIEKMKRDIVILDSNKMSCRI